MSRDPTPDVGKVYEIPRQDSEAADGARRTSSAFSASSASQDHPGRVAEAAFHGVVGDIVRLIEPNTEADPHALLAQLLVFAGNCIGHGPHVRIEADQHHCNLYAVLVGDSSRSRKGTSRGHVVRVLESVDADWCSNSIQTGLSSGEGIIWALRDPIRSEKDGEEVIEDPGVQDKRLLAYLPEFASLLKVMTRQGNTLSPVLREGWDSNTLQILTKNTPVRATGTHLSVVGHITVPEVRRLLTDTDAANGFANRFLWVFVRRARVLPFGGQVDGHKMRPLVERLRKSIITARRITEVHFGPEARERWADIYTALAQERPGLVGSITARAEAQVLRLASEYALLDAGATIEFPHLEAAYAVWRYCDESAVYVFGDALGDPVADRIFQALQRSPKGLSRTNINDYLGGHFKKAEIDRALGRLSEIGKARYERRPSDGGRNTEWWIAEKAEEAEEGGPERTSSASSGTPDGGGVAL